MTDADEDRNRIGGRGFGGLKWIAPLTGFLLLLLFSFLPPLEPLTPKGMKAVGVFLFTLTWWVSVGVGYPSLLCIILLVVTGVMTATEAFAASLGSWLIFFLIGCFGLSEALNVTGFARRFALWFLSRPFAAGRPWLLLALFLLGCTLMGAVMSATVTCIVFLTIGAAMLETLGYQKGEKFPAVMMMGIAWTSTASLSMTPIAHAGNLLIMEWIRRDFGYTMTFPQWMLMGIPLGLLVYLLLLMVFRFFIRPDVKNLQEMSDRFVRKEANSLGPMSRSEKIAAGVFLAVIITWLLPGLIDGALPAVGAYLKKIGYAVPAVLGACLLCLIRAEGKPVLTFEQWMVKGVEWGSMALVAAVVVLGDLVGNPNTGIPQFLTQIFDPLVTGVTPTVFLVVTLVWVVSQTNMMSNFVSMTLVYTILVPIAGHSSVVDPKALAVTIAMASNYAFSLPSATTATALAIGSGWVPVSFMARWGLVLVLPIVLLFVFLGYPFIAFCFR